MRRFARIQTSAAQRLTLRPPPPLFVPLFHCPPFFPLAADEDGSGLLSYTELARATFPELSNKQLSELLGCITFRHAAAVQAAVVKVDLVAEGVRELFDLYALKRVSAFETMGVHETDAVALLERFLEIEESEKAVRASALQVRKAATAQIESLRTENHRLTYDVFKGVFSRFYRFGDVPTE